MSQSVKFCVFADFHYMKQVYPVTQEHLDAILRRAVDNKVDFVVQLGDFCNDILVAPEITRYYTENPYDLPAYGVYGGHDLEYVEFSGKDLPRDNTMGPVTKLLNSDDDVVWGTEDGTIGDGSIGYYYFDCGGFRFVSVDSQYSQNPETGEWMKNITYHCEKGQQRSDRLGDKQLAWLENVLTDAAHKDIPCIIFAHSPAWHGYGGTEPEVKELFDKVNGIRKGTVMACFNGHLHTNRPTKMVDNVLYIDINATINAWWMGAKAKPHYTAEHTYEYTEYDANGNAVSKRQRPYIELWQGQNTWFVKEPLSAIVTVDTDGTVTVDGMETDWVYGIAPETPEDAYFAKEFVHCAPRIDSSKNKVER
ncbi:MAG: metallophosphoesterase [Clostridia bacterium]|nr:metallophosphoesterase [Clostridia bacterium]